MSIRWRVLLAGVAGLLARSSGAAPSSSPLPVRTYVFRPGPAAALVARMDASWEEKSRYHDGDLREIRFVREAAGTTAAKSGRGKLLVTPLATLPADQSEREDVGGRKTVERQLDEMKKGAVEKAPAITEGKIGSARWVWFTVTDAHPKPGEFAKATQGVLTLGDVPCSVTILHDDLRTRDDVVAQLAGWSLFGAADVVTPAPDDAPARLQAACRRGDGLACGLVYELSHDSLEPAKGLELLTTGCNAGSAFACGSLGSLYAEGKDVAKDEARAMKILVRGCDAHGFLACVNAATVSARGQAKEAPLPPRSVAFLDRACGYGGDQNGVCRYSNDGDASPVAYVAAQRKGCSASDAAACRRLGWAIETGYGDAAVDVDAARAAYAKACAGHDLWGCFRQALFTADVKEQARLYEAACRGGSGPACYALAQPRYGQPADARRKLLRQACESSIESACVGVMSDLGSDGR